MSASGQPRRVTTALLALMLGACGGGGGGGSPPPPSPPQPPAGSTLIPEATPAPGSLQVQMPFLNRPFSGNYAVTNFMDHEGPEGPGNPTGGYQLTWRGQRGIPCADAGGRKPCVGYDSHAGYDWLLPLNTPLIAMADGEVLFAGEETPQPCLVMNGAMVAAKAVRIGHRAPNGEIFTSVYVHMNRVDVAAGDRVTAGQEIGLSGDSGCVSSTNGVKDAHLHFVMGRVVNGLLYFTDLYGWDGQGDDPLETNPKGKRSTWLWNPGQAPSLVPPS